MSRRAPKPPVLVPHEVEIEGLDPAHDGVRIAHLSDIHVGNLTPAEHVAAAVELASAAGADVIAMTGDFVCWRKNEIGMLREQLAGLSAHTRVVATLGNHDYFTSASGVRRALTSHGYEVLVNRHTTAMVRGAPLHLVGIDDPVTRHHDLDRAFAGVPAEGTRVVLCHCPEQAPGLAERGADLVLSGHTHGGQIYLRGVTDRIITRMGKRYRKGFYRLGERGDGAHLYVTPGVGFSGLRVRVGDGTQAEVALFTLRAPRAAATAA
jgi:predicted MPP superfamily phosphohydrolase